jgi:tight adherence protein B
MRARVIAAVVAVAVLVPVGNAGAAPHMSVLASHFPTVNLLLTLPQRVNLTPALLRLRENGQPVSFSLQPGSVLGEQQFGAVLAIDASDSMHGVAIANAVQAARQFAAQRNPLQPMGVIIFNQQVQTLLPLTTSASTITAALSVSPPLGHGTRIFDAAAQGLSLLRDAHIRAGAVIILSDGADTGSITGQPGVVAAARAMNARIFSIGLRTRAYNPATLQALAVAANGTFEEASTAHVAALFAALGSELSNQYLVSYRSTAPLGSRLSIAARTPLVPGVAQASFVAPTLAAPSLRRAAPTAGGFWQSTGAGVAIALLCAVLLGSAVLVVLAPRRSVRHRVEQFTGSSAAPESQQAWLSAVTEGARRRDAPAGPATRWWRAFLRDLELAGISTPPGQLLAGTAIVTAVLAWALAAAASSVVGIFLALAVPVAGWLTIRSQMARQRRAFDEQLPDNLQVIASSMRAGHSFAGAMNSMVTDAPEPSRREFRRIVADEQLGVPIDDAMERTAARMDSHDFQYVAAVIRLQSDAGGNTAEILDRVIDTLRDRQDLRRLVRTLTAQGRLAHWIVTALPVLLLIALTLIASDYMHPLYHRALGIITLIVGALLLFAGSLTIRRIVDIDP